MLRPSDALFNSMSLLNRRGLATGVIRSHVRSPDEVSTLPKVKTNRFYHTFFEGTVFGLECVLIGPV